MEELIQGDKSYIANTYARLQVAFRRGRGCLLWDVEGREYLDLIAGIAVLNLGHSHPRVVEAIREQASSLMHTSNLYHIENQVALGEKLYRLSGGYKSFFSNSGSEAVETALKLARKHTGRKEVISAHNSFHGRTMGSLSVTGQKQYREDFEPLVPGFKQVEYGDIEALEREVTPDTAAVILEPIQGEGGVIEPPRGYLEGVEELCRERDVLFILDEIQTAMGRVGGFFRWQEMGVNPDIFTLAKALGNGFPIGATLAREEIMESFSPGDHASTFGGNPLATRVAGETIDVLREEKLTHRSDEMGSYLKARLEEFRDRYDLVREVRGRGLMLGVELEEGCRKLVEKSLQKGLLLNCVHGNTLRLLPPLVISRAQLDYALEKIDHLLGEIKNEA